MKRFAVVFWLTMCVTLSSMSLQAQSLADRVAAAILILQNSGYTIVDSDASYLKQGQSYRGNRTCYRGNEYLVMAVTSWGVKDLDMYIYDERGNKVTEDLKSMDDGVAAVSFRMNYSSDITIKAKNYRSLNKYKAYKVVIIVAYI